ncbi:hypothetical protein ACF1BE_12980 [Streptomyces sp. NPDC014991]|uniref:hypothetical protein n=1 Tax=Streptomyces sp. NPDC014991 TaxID=3364935 RepID=UPI0037006D49
MQGHGYGQPVKQPPHTAWLVLLRVLFVALGILTIGFLAWAMLLRLAAVTRRSLDWGLFVAVLAADILGIVLLAAEPGDDIHTAGGYTGILLLLGALVATTGYYLAADIRHFLVRQQAYRAQQQAYQAQRQAPAYGYPAVATPYTAATVPTMPATPTAPVHPVPVHPAAPHNPPVVPHPPVPRPPLATPPPQRPAPARIDQVRAELDELSDYLRRHDGQEGGR